MAFVRYVDVRGLPGGSTRRDEDRSQTAYENGAASPRRVSPGRAVAVVRVQRVAAAAGGRRVWLAQAPYFALACINSPRGNGPHFT